MKKSRFTEEQIIVKMRRRLKKMKDEAREQYEAMVGETVAHLNRLVEQGRIERHLDNGVWRFTAL